MAAPLQPLGTSLPLDLREDVFQSRVVEAARWTGWSFSYHTLHSKGSTAGWPDLVLGRPRRTSFDAQRRPLPLPELAGDVGLLFVELKTEDRKSKATPAQLACLELLYDAGCSVALWRPSDWPDIVEILSGRATPTWPPLSRSGRGAV